MYMYQKILQKWGILSFSFLTKFGQRPYTIVQGLWPNFGANLKIYRKSNFDRYQLKRSTQHKYMYMYQKIFFKMGNSLLVIFDKIWLETMHYSTESLARFWSKFKKFIENPILIGISLNVLHNISTCICIRKYF